MENGGLVPARSASFKSKHPMPITRSSKDVGVVTTGGRGSHPGVILPWALHGKGCIEPIMLSDGAIVRNIEELKQS